MNILIIEDETAAVKRLQVLILKVSPTARIAGRLETVRDAVAWLQSNPPPDLIIADIQLADGISFNIFSQIKINTPIIFTTAYDEYMQQAFKLHSIDYLLKPIDKGELQRAITKYQTIKTHFLSENLDGLIEQTAQRNVGYRSGFLVKRGSRLIPVSGDEIVYFRADDRLVFLHDIKGQQYIIGESLDDLEKTLNPAIFFRLNRRYIARIDAIETIKSDFNGKLHVALKHSPDNEIFVSREKAGLFKKWLKDH